MYEINQIRLYSKKKRKKKKERKKGRRKKKEETAKKKRMTHMLRLEYRQASYLQHSQSYSYKTVKTARSNKPTVKPIMMRKRKAQMYLPLQEIVESIR